MTSTALGVSGIVLVQLKAMRNKINRDKERTIMAYNFL
jgi:hypothetical protein